MCSAILGAGISRCQSFCSRDDIADVSLLLLIFSTSVLLFILLISDE